MKRKYKSVFKSTISLELTAKAPCFALWNGKSQYIWQGEIVYFCATDSTTAFLVFSPHTSFDNQFAVELGWSDHHRFPEVDMRPAAGDPAANRSANGESEFITRLSFLTRDYDKWWKFKNEDALVDAVASSIQDFVDVGIPYLQLD